MTLSELAHPTCHPGRGFCVLRARSLFVSFFFFFLIGDLPFSSHPTLSMKFRHTQTHTHTERERERERVQIPNRNGKEAIFWVSARHTQQTIGCESSACLCLTESCSLLQMRGNNSIPPAISKLNEELLGSTFDAGRGSPTTTTTVTKTKR